ncbi:NAD(P)H-dependent oxidoreductase, partial [Staphylococcus pseudintermedius]
SLGREPWNFLVINVPDMREALKSFRCGAQGQCDTPSHFVLILARKYVSTDT